MATDTDAGRLTWRGARAFALHPGREHVRGWTGLVAAAALSAPSRSLLVETTAGLDAADATAVHEALRAERDAGRAVVVGTTRPGDVRAGDRVAFLRDGRVARAGTLADLREDLRSVVRVSGDGGSLDLLGSFVAGAQVFENGTNGRNAYMSAQISIGETVQND